MFLKARPWLQDKMMSCQFQKLPSLRKAASQSTESVYLAAAMAAAINLHQGSHWQQGSLTGHMPVPREQHHLK
jgi:hypothetical protein